MTPRLDVLRILTHITRQWINCTSHISYPKVFREYLVPSRSTLTMIVTKKFRKIVTKEKAQLGGRISLQLLHPTTHRMIMIHIYINANFLLDWYKIMKVLGRKVECRPTCPQKNLFHDRFHVQATRTHSSGVWPWQVSWNRSFLDLTAYSQSIKQWIKRLNWCILCFYFFTVCISIMGPGIPVLGGR